MKKDQWESNRQMILMQSFWQLQKAIMTQVKQTAANNGLSIPQFSILVMMHQQGTMTQKKLLALTHFPKSTLSHAIEGMVQAGLMNRTHVEGNRREIDLALSNRGKALIDHMRRQDGMVHARFKRAVDSFSEEEFENLIDNHQQIIAFFESGETT